MVEVDVGVIGCPRVVYCYPTKAGQDTVDLPGPACGAGCWAANATSTTRPGTPWTPVSMPLVILGAGLDTRGYRLAAPNGVPVFEVDLPANIDYKRARVRSIFGWIPEHVTLVPVDFKTDDLAQALPAHGFRLENRTLFVWEAVTQYLTAEGAVVVSVESQHMTPGPTHKHSAKIVELRPTTLRHPQARIVCTGQ
jgi:hypothetical protein